MAGPYRSGPPRGGSIDGLDELEQKLRRGVRIRRLVMGFLALVSGMGLIVVGTMMSMQRGTLRISIAMVLFGVLLAAIAFVILRRGELKEGEGLDVYEEDPIPWSTLGMVSAGIIVVMGLIAAYPLGVYTWAGTLNSGCRKVLTPKDMAAMGLPAFNAIDVWDRSGQCGMTGREPNSGLRIVNVNIHPISESSFNYAAEHAGKTTPIPNLGDAAYLEERRGETTIVVRRGHAWLSVQMASRLYDHAAAMKIAKHLETKLALVDRYAKD